MKRFTAPIEARARDYLHANGSQCRGPSGGTSSSPDRRATTSFAATKVCGVAPPCPVDCIDLVPAPAHRDAVREADASLARHEFRQFRLHRDETERDERLRAKRDSLSSI